MGPQEMRLADSSWLPDLECTHANPAQLKDCTIRGMNPSPPSHSLPTDAEKCRDCWKCDGASAKQQLALGIAELCSYCTGTCKLLPGAWQPLPGSAAGGR
ncbi:hypothetical protein ABPG75_011117 [Micractinium tetrahymenae]